MVHKHETSEVQDVVEEFLGELVSNPEKLVELSLVVQSKASQIAGGTNRLEWGM